jgi:glycosyltransferase involved in cell wall biosynthesis
LSARDADARAAKPARILVISPWETVWSLGRDGDVKAGVSDDDRFIDAFTRAGYELHFLRPRSARTDERVTTHFYPNFFRATRALPTPLRRPLWPLCFHALVAPRALSLARALRPDVVLGHSHYATLTTRVIRARLGIPSATKLFGVMDLVHTEWPAAKYLFKNLEQLLALKFAQDAWIVLDDGTRGGEIVRGRGVPADRVHFLPNGLNVEWIEARPDRAQARRRFGIPEGAPVVLFLARLVDSKRPLDLVRAAARPGAGANTVFVFAGDGPLRGGLERAAREAGLGDRVRFTGTVAHDDVPALMAASDLFVSTSTLTNRALPACEAMLCGVPVVAYDTGDTATVVRDGATGVLAPDGDVSALADAIGRLLADAPLRARLAAAARDLARATFVSWEKRTAMEMEIFDRLAASRPRAARG